MKQTYLAIAFLMMIATSKNSGAQGNNDVPLNPSNSTGKLKAKAPAKKMSKANVTDVNANVLKNFIHSHENLSEIKVIRVNIKAARDFTRKYKNVSDAKWFKTEGGYTARFISNGIDTRIVYNDKGRWFYNVLAYTEADLSFDLRDMVKSKYYDNAILAVYQYEFRDKTIYIFKMQDQQSNMISLKVCDGEIVDITDREKN
jgi:hypothetical protein